ncbi:MAG: ABC transporter permease [Eubacteriales bacterium]|nr:ABC transporter permease [Eubacteriales bacterium]
MKRGRRKTCNAPDSFGGMKNYLDLIPVSGKVHRRQSRMTRICIMLAVALVSVIFGMADMEIRCQKIQTISENGSWHAAFKCLTREQEAMLKARPEVETAAWYDVVNYRLDQGYFLEDEPAAICGMEEAFLSMFPSITVEEGDFPADENSALFTESVKARTGAAVGDTLTLTLPDGSRTKLTVSGFTEDVSSLLAGGAFGVFMNRDGFARIAPGEIQKNEDGVIYTQFVPRCSIQKTLADIRQQLDLAQDRIAQNAILLGVMGQSRDPYIRTLYTAAAALAVLVMAAGILMIAGSLNSDIARRTGFFGMLRCLGATPRQIIRFVRLEALNWCKTAVPEGLFAGMLVIWILCALLRRLAPAYFGDMPVWGISLPGILAGALLGIATVWLAAQSPAQKAAKVSPLTAVSGNAQTVPAAKRAANTKLFPVDVAMGVHHAAGSKRNFLLMTGSFAFTIILFLAFSATIDFMNHAITPLKPYTPDLSVVSPDNTCSISKEQISGLEENPAVKRAYGRSFAYDVPVLLDGHEGKINLISYEKYQFEWAKEMLLEGSVEEAEAGGGVMIVYAYAGENAVQPGSVITIGEQQIKVSAVLSYSPFSQVEGTETVICTEELFEKLTGEQGYTIIDIQLNGGTSDAEVDQIRRIAGENVTFSDQRMKNQEARGTYYAYAVFLYGFLAVIILIAAFNIINSIAMSVSARIQQYGAMRAVGMSGGQLVKMVAAQAGTYALGGMIIGYCAGLPIHRFLFEKMVTFRWGDPWHFPASYAGVIAAVVLISTAAAVYGPAKRIKEMSVVDTISNVE